VRRHAGSRHGPGAGRGHDKGADKEIVVTGIRQSLANALSAKRFRSGDGCHFAEDVGKFPDKNVGEALQRITGVQISRAGGEGSAVSIRGVDPGLIRVEVNGQSQRQVLLATLRVPRPTRRWNSATFRPNSSAASKW
jgi:outer membrane receptor for ferrienterochelin and colicin